MYKVIEVGKEIGGENKKFKRKSMAIEYVNGRIIDIKNEYSGYNIKEEVSDDKNNVTVIIDDFPIFESYLFMIIRG